MIKVPTSDMAFLEYSFLFDPKEVDWPTIQDFERDLADYFAAHQIEAKIMKTIEGQFGRRILYLTKAEVNEPPKLTTKLQPASKQLAHIVKSFGK